MFINTGPLKFDGVSQNETVTQSALWEFRETSIIQTRQETYRLFG